jgi:hypothetical protein
MEASGPHTCRAGAGGKEIPDTGVASAFIACSKADYQEDTMAYPANHHRMFLTCYTDTFNYGWHHVDLFVHDEHDREVNWVHWGVAEDGPEAADASLTTVEPKLERTSEWKHGTSEAGLEYWTAEAAWLD